jgi:hypothetical protein
MTGMELLMAARHAEGVATLIGVASGQACRGCCITLISNRVARGRGGGKGG